MRFVVAPEVGPPLAKSRQEAFIAFARIQGRALSEKMIVTDNAV